MHFTIGFLVTKEYFDCTWPKLKKAHVLSTNWAYNKSKNNQIKLK